MIKKIILSMCLLLIGAICLAWSLLQYRLNQPLNIQQSELITVQKGSTINSFSQELVNRGWLDSRFWLRNYVRLNPKLSSIKTGTYLIPVKTTLRELLSQVVTGKEHQFSMTFVEGSTFKEWLSQLAHHPQLTHTLEKHSIAEIAKLLTIAVENPEGLFFPDTYLFTHGTKDIEILARAYQKMQTELSTLWQNRKQGLPYATSYEALILASIIEKESGQINEQAIIASVFINRINKNMRLQTDPTVIYGLGDRYQGDIKRDHLREKTPYNTYRINGLPPTPIAMPGLLALQAAMNPIESNYYYFVSDGNGKHVFSSDLKEHNRAVAQYLQNTKAK